jgi:hypothetical protein
VWDVFQLGRLQYIRIKAVLSIWNNFNVNFFEENLLKGVWKIILAWLEMEWVMTKPWLEMEWVMTKPPRIKVWPPKFKSLHISLAVQICNTLWPPSLPTDARGYFPRYFLVNMIHAFPVTLSKLREQSYNQGWFQQQYWNYFYFYLFKATYTVTPIQCHYAYW